MYDELGGVGERRYTVQRIDDEFDAGRPVNCRYLEKV